MEHVVNKYLKNTHIFQLWLLWCVICCHSSDIKTSQNAFKLSNMSTRIQEFKWNGWWLNTGKKCALIATVGIVTGYKLDGPGIESRWGEIFCTCPDQPWGPPSLLYNGYRVFPGVKRGLGVTLTPPPLLVPWSRTNRAIPLLPLWVVQPVQSLSTCTRVHFTL
jgi:hypothetical protein